GMLSKRELERPDSGQAMTLIESMEFEYITQSRWQGSDAVWMAKERKVDFQVADENPGGSSTPGTASKVIWEYDDYGNVVMEETDPDLAITGDEVSVVNTYEHVPQSHRFDEIQTRVTWYGGDAPREEVFEYDNWGNLTFSGTLDPHHGRTLGVRHTLNRLGNVLTSEAPDGGVTHYAYGANDVDVTVTDAVGNTVSKTFDLGFGVERTRTDENGVTTTFELDGFGRTTAIHHRAPNEGEQTLKTFQRQLYRHQPDGPAAGYVMRVRTREAWLSPQPSDWRQEVVWMDTLDRVRVGRREYRFGEVTNGLATEWVQTDRHYHDKIPELLASESRPFYEGEATPPLFTHYVYDAKKRPLVTYRPDEQTIQMVYNDVAREVTRFEPGSTLRTQLDARGNLTLKEDARGALTAFAYDNLSQLTWVLDPASVYTRVDYDVLGRKKFLVHSDTGVTQFVYDRDGRMIGEIDPKGQIVVRSAASDSRATICP
ncbi:MAG: hypothetical protein AAFY60_14645, partial [Myxococcota bacterium]